jgi:hypothetical protein
MLSEASKILNQKVLSDIVLPAITLVYSLIPSTMASFSEPDKKPIENRDRGGSTSIQDVLSNAPALVQKPSSKMTQNMVTLNPFGRVPADVLSLVL